MLWPLMLPLQFTLALWLVIVVGLTLVAPAFKLRQAPVFWWSLLSAMVLFVPSCTSIMTFVDSVRFGDFQYQTFSDIPDERSRRYMPPMATTIEMFKFKDGSGYVAKYRLSDTTLQAYLDELWTKYGDHSAVARGSMMGEGRVVDEESFNLTFGMVGWKCPTHAIEYHSPSEADGGGAVYYLDTDQSTVYQRTGFW